MPEPTKAFAYSLVVMSLCSLSALGDGSATWTGASSSDFYDAGNWSGATGGNPAGVPNGHATFNGGLNTTIERTSGTYNYIFGLFFTNVLGTDEEFTIGLSPSSGVAFNWGGPTIQTSAVTDGGSLTDVINSNINLNGGNVGQRTKVVNTGLDHNLLFNGVIAGGNTTDYSFTKNGVGTMTLSGLNTYDVVTTVSNGTLEITNKDGFGTTSAGTVVENGATARLNLAKQASGESFTINGAGFGGGGALNVIDSGITGSITLASDSSISVTTRFDHGGTIEGSGFTLTKLGSGSMVRGSAFNASHLIVDEGQYVATGAAAIVGGSGTSITVNSGAELNLWANLSVTSDANLLLNDGSTYAVTSSGESVSSINGSMVLNGSVDFNNWSQKHTVHSDLSGAGGVTLKSINNNQDYAQYTFSGDNSYTGSTTVGTGSAGVGKMTLKAGSSTALSSNSAFTVTANSTLALDGNSNSVGSLAGAGTVENANASAATLSAGGDNTSTTFSGLLQDGIGGGALSLTKSGNGALTLSGANTYTGLTTVNGGTLLITGNNTAASGAVTVNSGGTLAGAGTAGVIGGDTAIAAGGAFSLVDGQVASLLTLSGELDISAVTTGALKFELDAGGASDVVALDNLIMSDLELSDFAFTDLGGTAAGTYTLFDANSITGGFGAGATGTLFGFDAELAQSGNNVVLNLTAVPEPSTALFSLLGISALVLRRRRD